MSRRRHLIDVGMNPGLLSARASVLQDAGYTVVSLHPDTPTLELFLTLGADLVLVCHTVTGMRHAHLAKRVDSSRLTLLNIENHDGEPGALLAQVTAAIQKPPQM